MRRILEKVLYNSGGTWSSHLQDAAETINDHYNRFLKTSPNIAYTASKENQQELHQNQLTRQAKTYKQIDTVLEVGDSVRVAIPKAQIQKKGLATYTKEIYTIIKVIPPNNKKFTIARYSIKDRFGTKVKGNYPLSKLQ